MNQRMLFLFASLPLLTTGCEIFQGPSPGNDPPVIESIGTYSFLDSNGEVSNYWQDIYLAAGERQSFPIVVSEPEGEAITVGVGPIPRGWSYDPDTQTLVASPDAQQSGLVFVITVAAEDSHSPAAYDVRELNFTVF